MGAVRRIRAPGFLSDVREEERNDMTDICANKHGGNAESEAANKRVVPAKSDLRELIRQWFVFRGSAGGTCEEAARELGIRYTNCSARCSEMKADRTLIAVVDEKGKPVRRKTTSGSSAGVFRARTPAERSGAFDAQPSLFA